MSIVPFRKKVYLDEDSWIWIGTLPEDLHVKPTTFEEIWGMHPDTRHKVVIGGRVTEVKRFQKSFGRDYSYSGTVNIADPMPDIFNTYIHYFSALYNVNFNMALVNWYNHGLDFISAHKDDAREMVDGTPIVTISFGSSRKFKIKKTGTSHTYTLNNNTYLSMMGETNKHYTHEILKDISIKTRRISITLRCFK